jgi:hypothetical protein
VSSAFHTSHTRHLFGYGSLLSFSSHSKPSITFTGDSLFLARAGAILQTYVPTRSTSQARELIRITPQAIHAGYTSPLSPLITAVILSSINSLNVTIRGLPASLALNIDFCAICAHIVLTRISPYYNCLGRLFNSQRIYSFHHGSVSGNISFPSLGTTPAARPFISTAPT